MSDDNGSDLEFDNGNEEYRQHDGQINQKQDEQMHEENHMGMHRFQEQYDPDMSFERDVDTLMKVKAKIMFNLNKERQVQEIPILYEDLTLSSIAMQYATSLKGESADETYLNRLNEQQRFHEYYLPCTIVSKYEDDVQITKKLTENFFIETAYLFLEMDNERQTLMDSLYTHIGIGLAGNEENIVIVLLVTRKDLTITQIRQIGQDQVDVRGKILSSNHYVFMGDVYDSGFNEIGSSMYDRIEFNRTSKQFVIHLDVKINWKQRRWIQIYTTGTEPIGNKKPSKQRKNKIKRDLNDKFLSLFHLYPDQRYIQCYNEEVEAEQTKQGKLSGMLLDSLHNKEAEVPQLSQEKYSDNDNSDKDSSESDEVISKKSKEVQEHKTSNRQIKQQLQMAIGQAKNAYDGIVYQNQKHQAKIKEMREKNNITLDRTGEGSMNEHKYLNILAQVHQTRVQLQQTQDRYNKMSFQLQNKLNQKQSKCNDIRSAFQDLKKEVAKKATYSRSDQPVKAHKIEEWEEKQSKLTQQLQNLRLQILRARNALSKNQKILKKKEQLAEGLHLIDFEQLKIENQTLNERLEERNQDLHKLKKKTTTMVQILTHTRQKLVFVEKMKADLLETTKKLDIQIQGYRSQINSSKEQCQKLRLQIQDAKQQTQIVNSQQLVVDFKRRAQNIQKLDEQLKELLEREKEMKTVIEMYQRKMKKQAITH